MTISEELFERYCANAKLVCRRIPEESGKTPDYELVIGTQVIVAEVKEIEQNPKELESDRLLAKRGYGNVLSDTPGQRGADEDRRFVCSD
jgi:hypothetical protein